MTIEIALSKKGKKAGLYVSVIDDCDADLAKLNWSIQSSKSIVVYAKNRNVLMHRLIWERTYGEVPNGMRIDHINGNGLDNRHENMRLVTHQQNTMNRGKNRNNASGYKGVHLDKKTNRYVAQIKESGKNHRLGSFLTREDAYAAYCEAVDKYHQGFGNKGEPK